MEAIIEVEELRQDWKPPFAKKRETKSFTLKEGETFETLRDGAPLFTLQSIQGDKVLVQYSRHYSLKGFEHPTERKIWLNIHDPKKFSSLWEDNGVTKTVTLRQVNGVHSDPAQSPENRDVTENTEIYRP